MSNAWHLRNDGQAFPVQVHLYPMQDPDLSSEAEVAAFLIKTNSKDLDLASLVLDSFMVLLLEHEGTRSLESEESIEAALENKLSHLPFKFAYPLEIKDLLQLHRDQHNFYDLDSTVEFLNYVQENIESIQKKIKDSFNQQFIRVRYGGKLNTNSGNHCLWFRIASVDYNWDNVIYIFASETKRKRLVEYITICRDPESDELEEDYFYRAKDGTTYYFMPIDEFFTEEHENNPVFSSTDIGVGAIQSIRRQLAQGNTLLGAYDFLEKEGISCSRDYRSYLFRTELRKNWISASQWFEELGTRTKMKIAKVMRAIKQKFPEILDVDIDFQTRENSNGNPTGFELLCTLVSDHPKIDNTVISVASTKPLMSYTADSLIYKFNREYTDFLKFRRIEV